LRLWESPEIAVVLGRSSKMAEEANLAACQTDEVPIVRRTSGGCAVVVGPGCLMYSLVLSYERRPHLRLLDETHRFVLSGVQRALSGVVANVIFAGTSDLTSQGRKIGGNSVRCKRNHFLYHGTLLCDFAIERISSYLRSPPREPEYRAGRSHEAFVANLRIEPDLLRNSLRDVFAASESLNEWPRERVSALMIERYGRAEWHAER
jgi:lipoate-protein ligase A